MIEVHCDSLSLNEQTQFISVIHVMYRMHTLGSFHLVPSRLSLLKSDPFLAGSNHKGCFVRLSDGFFSNERNDCLMTFHIKKTLVYMCVCVCVCACDVYGNHK